MTIKELCKQAHIQAIDKGFWIPSENIVEGKIPKVRYRNMAELLMLIVSELGEACEALRNNNRQPYKVAEATIIKRKDKYTCKVSEPHKQWIKDTFEDELADTVIRIADLCQALGIDLEWQIQKKLEYNKTREYKHNKEF